ncbi:ATP-dependent DNA helicase RecG [Ruminococcus albus]|uniref:ATP-dependent DNA helicase RecG n=1 Tax=Ruminococcus albus (strain ATCC 27210 / DSM 20455 / JCM 14654 / NCDO 2250 / 7) TaxID=697329 RepID=E6UE15_RUMA7|nr:ATP-dependent DNA helicase RecG [Ruminococcus albus]ADU22880.1 ATP-dependent DNA helicase RecG [Ruminococcus albus 7 = DSM 20455]
MLSELAKPVMYLSGVGPKKSELYEKLGVKTVYDLLYHFPRYYIDLNEPQAVRDAPLNEQVVLKGRVVRKLPEGNIRRGLTVYKAIVTDDTADITIVIYNAGFMFKALEVGHEYYLVGKLTGNMLRREINSPQIYPVAGTDPVQPVYRLTEGLTQKQLRQNVHTALGALDGSIYEPLPNDVVREQGLCSLSYALQNVHYPTDMHTLELAKSRLVFDELLTLALGMLMMKNRSRDNTGCQMNDESVDEYFSALPFELTAGQKSAINDCIEDMRKPFPMNRLIQGDVGSGKTAVAAGAAYFAYKNGCQTALMAPTEILAGQHYDTLKAFLEPLGVKVVLLTGSLTPKKKEKIKAEIAAGEYNVIVGTHALVQASTEFKRLGLVITDEQHRFGVEQRAMLAGKGDHPHKLVMSATPIPRTLALMIYGDLDISVLKELPKGRQPVETYAVTGKLRERAFGYVKQYLEEGRQAYIVCPMIEESDSDLRDVKSYAKEISEGAFSGYRVGLLHGRLSAESKEKVMKKFKAHELDILVSTTVVEVGVDVPNAAVMVIENSDRFGLSQLHQLRGRVGRGEHKSVCILITDNPTEEVVQRLKILSSCHDGFEISQQDLKLRGPGDFFGSRQHGLPKMKIADMSQDMDVLVRAQETAKQILCKDTHLDKGENRGLRELVERLFEQETAND